MSRAAYALALLLLAACPGGQGHDTPADPLVYGGDRPVTLQVPAGIQAGEAYPLVLVLHGYGATGELQQWYLQVTTAALEGGAFVLAPDGRVDNHGQRFWNASPACCAFFSASAPDDVAYLGGLLDAVVADWPIDPSRILVFGHSNGAFMAYRLACDRADRVTALAGLAGSTPSADGAGCAPAAPVSVLHLHGTADATVPYAGGLLPDYPTVPFAGAEAAAAQWAAHDGCDGGWAGGEPLDLVSSLEGAETRTSSAGGCPAGVGVALWTIEGGGHVPLWVDGVGARVLAWLAAHPRDAD